VSTSHMCRSAPCLGFWQSAGYFDLVRRNRVGAQLQSGVGVLHGLPHHPYEVASQGLHCGRRSVHPRGYLCTPTTCCESPPTL
jgi:hypothetical protein